jgi:WD40 repeat protein
LHSYGLIGTMKIIQGFITSVLLISLLWGCSPKPPTVSLNTPTASIKTTIPPTSSVVSTPKPQASPTILPTPTMVAPSLKLEKITSENATSLSQIKLIGDGRIRDVAFSSGGGLIASGSSIGIRIHGGQDLIERAFIPSAASVTRVTFSPDGKLLAVGTEAGRVLIYTVDSLITSTKNPINPVREIKANNFAITCLLFSPDSQSLTSGSLDRTILVWNPTTGKRIRSLGGFLLGISTITYSSDSTMLAGGSVDGSIRVWSIRTGEVLNSTGTPERNRRQVDHYPLSLGFLPDGWLLLTWADGAVSTWDWHDKKSESQVILQNDEKYIHSIISPANNSLMIITQDSTMQVLHSYPNSTTGVRLEKESSLDLGTEVVSASLSTDGKWLAVASYPAQISLINLGTEEILMTYSREPQGQQVIASAFSPDSRFLATSHGDDLVRIWDALNMQNYFEVEISHIEPTQDLQFSSDGKQLICGADGIYLLPTTEFPNLLQQWSPDTSIKLPVDLQATRKIDTGGTVQTIAISIDGDYLASSNLMKKTIQLWDTQTGKLIGNLGGMLDPVEVLAFAPDSLTLAAGAADHKVYIWNLDNIPTATNSGGAAGESKYLLEKPDLIIKSEFPVLSMVYSPDGSQLAMAGTGWNVRVVKSANGELISNLKGSKDQINSLTISPDGKIFTSGGADGIIRVYVSGQESPLIILDVHAGNVNTLNFSPDGRMLISGGEDSTIRVWGISR